MENMRHEEYVGSLNLPDKYKTELLDWANQEKNIL